MRQTLICLTTAATILSAAFVAVSTSRDAADELAIARGVVFHDANGNGRLDAGEKRLSDIRVSNGADIVKTSADGQYEIPVNDDSIVFVIKPTGWRTPISENQIPRFYYIHKPKGSPPLKFQGVAPTGDLPKSIDFALYPQAEPEQFKAILFGDPQPRNQQEIDYIAHDVIEELVGTDASFGVTLGDILFDDLSLFEAQARSIALLGIPWYNVVGNHDINYDAPNDSISDETFERHFGPAYYSFDHGPVHFIVLDDIEWHVPDAQSKGSYRGGLGGKQLEFVKNDLSLIPGDQLVVLMMHIPLTDVHDRGELYRLIEQRPFCMSVSGHTHYHQHRMITRDDGWMGPEPHHHIVNVTVSGSWWSGTPDERGIPHTICKDGTPNGYSIISFDGAEYRLDYKAAGRPADYQMQIDAPEVIAVADSAETVITANVFNGTPKSVIEMRIGSGNWMKMEPTLRPDPTYTRIYDYEQSVSEKPWLKLPAPGDSSHLWEAKLPADLAVGSHLIEVQASNVFGKTYTGRRVVRVTK
mgnify:CR=1 FL=1|jgi:hypothetical protein